MPSPSLLIFGTVFLYRDFLYVYLAGTDEVWYAAKILDKELSAEIKRFANTQVRRNKDSFRKAPILCFVELKTEEFSGQVAHLGETEHDIWSETPKVIEVELNREDLKSLKEEIIRDDAPVPTALPKLIRDLDI